MILQNRNREPQYKKSIYNNMLFNLMTHNNKPRYEIPMLLKDINIPANVKKILLVDDVGVSGKTLKLAEEHLNNYEVTTMVMKGSGDIVLFPEILTCVNWPWN